MPVSKPDMIVGGVMAAMAGAFVLGVWVPESEKLAEYDRRIDAAQQELGPATHPSNIAEHQHVVAELSERIDASDRYVPADPELASLLRSLTEAVRGQGVEEHHLEAGEVQPFKHYSMIPLRMEMSGPFASAYGVVSQVEAMPRLVRLDALNLRAQDERRGGAPGQLRASLRLSTFFSDQQGEGR